MERHFWIWAFLVLFLLQGYGSFGCFDEERVALLELKASFCSSDCSSFPAWEDEESDCCEWERVECSNTTGRVLKLFLNNTRQLSQEDLYLNASLFVPFIELKLLNLSTNMLASLGDDDDGFERVSKLNNLELLDLSNNTLDSSILASLTELSSLKSLSLGSNILDGSTQELAALDNLEELDLSANQLDSFITAQGLKNLTKLKVLNLRTNIFNISTLKSLGILSSLKELYLGSNILEGSVTLKEMNNLRNLEVLDLSSNNLSSSILQIVELMPSLKALSLRSNGINGSQPALEGSFYGTLNFDSKPIADTKWARTIHIAPFFLSGLCKLKNLQELDLSDNGFEGSISPCLGNLTSLRALDLSKNRFSGNLDSSLFSGLLSLEFLSLSHNVFQTFPPISSFAKHSKLEVLDLICGNNTLLLENEDQSWVPSFQLKVFRLSRCILKTRSIPSFLHHQYDLRVVDLSGSNLTADFPTWLMKNNTRLEELNLKNNSLMGYFHLPNHPNIFTSAIDVSNNHLLGHLPSNISVSLPNIAFLNMSWNSFEGSIPSSFGSMRNLRFLDLSNNLFRGGIPEDLAVGCPSLQILILSNNDLHGQIFLGVPNLPSLTYLLLDGNHFSGKIPDLSNSYELERLDVSQNSISGKLPDWIGNMTNLEALVMPNNHLEGSIPIEFCSLDALQILDISNNSLSGSLPSCFSPSSLIHVHLQGNHLTGPLNKAFTRSMDLATLDVRNNNLSGNIPDWISMLSGLSILILKGNHFHGNIPSQLCQLSKITLLDLSYNNLSGHIPSCLNKIRFRTGFRSGKFSMISYFQAPQFSSYLYHGQHIELPSQVNLNSYPIADDKALAEFTTKKRADFYRGNILYSMTGIDLSSNKLTGTIPAEIGDLSLVRALNLSHNSLTGTIPAAMSGLKNIESLDLSYNNLTGTIPGELTELTSLAVFSVAYNNLSGRIPEMRAQFGTFLEDSYAGNPRLCGLLLKRNCGSAGEEEEEEAGTEEGGERGLTQRGVFFVSFGSAYVGVLLGVAAVLYINGDWREKWFHFVDMLINCCCSFVMHITRKFYC